MKNKDGSMSLNTSYSGGENAGTLVSLDEHSGSKKDRRPSKLNLLNDIGFVPVRNDVEVESFGNLYGELSAFNLDSLASFDDVSAIHGDAQSMKMDSLNNKNSKAFKTLNNIKEVDSC
mmetsp:Transcript_26195/g.23056  ORF Transcript_26195/g.23056 Transcript_26195/m.23056 type:complete len:118 (+) Transcript_26195:143-496(+)